MQINASLKQSNDNFFSFSLPLKNCKITKIAKLKHFWRFQCFLRFSFFIALFVLCHLSNARFNETNSTAENFFCNFWFFWGFFPFFFFCKFRFFAISVFLDFFLRFLLLKDALEKQIFFSNKQKSQKKIKARLFLHSLSSLKCSF